MIQMSWMSCMRISPHLLSLLLIFCQSTLTTEAQANPTPAGPDTGGPKYPVILVSDFGGSQLDVLLRRKRVDHPWCPKRTDGWETLWINSSMLFPDNNTVCLADSLRLRYNSKTHKSHDPEGVFIRVPGFGNTSTVEYLDDARQIPAFATLVHFLVENLTYTRDVNLRGAPYDWRKAPGELGGDMKRVVSLIEKTYEMNNNRKVVLIAHSYGAICTTYLLNHRSQEWKDRYIKAYVSMAGVYGGSTLALKGLASGFNFEISGVNSVILREAERTFPTSTLLVPSDSYWSKDEVLVYSPSGNYTVNDYPQFFNGINYPQGMLLRKDTKHYLKDLKPPNVEVHCLYGTGVPTADSYVYTGDVTDWFNSQPTQNNGDGDGLVNLRSLLGCQKWVGKQNEAVSLEAFPGAEHDGMLMDTDVLAYIARVLMD